VPSFGAEMKDFISAFSTGKKLFERSPEEKEQAALKSYTDDYLQQQEMYSADRSALPDAKVPQAVVSTDDPGTEVSNDTEGDTEEVVALAEGGAVEAIPTRRGKDGQEGALDFTLNEADAGRGDDLMNLDGAAEAFSTGLGYVANAFGLTQQSAVQDPQRRQRLVEYQRGAGAASPQEVEGVFNVVDPKRQMSEGQRMVASMWAGYKFYLERGEPEKAAKYAGSLAQYSRARSMMLGNFAIAALEAGDTAGAAKLLTSAYNTIPDGRDIVVNQVGADGIDYSLVGADGKVTEKGKAGVRDLQRLAAGAATGQVFDQEAARVRQSRAQRGSGGKRSNTDGREAIVAYKQAEAQYNAAMESGDEQAAAAAKQAMDAAYYTAVRANSAWENAQYGIAGQKRTPGTGTQRKSVIRDPDTVAQIDETLGNSVPDWEALSPGGKMGLRNLTADIIDNNDVALDEATSLALQIVESGDPGDVVLSERGKKIINPKKSALPVDEPAEGKAAITELGNRQADIAIPEGQFPEEDPAFAKGGMVEDLDYWAEEKARKYRSMVQ
jgi:hypothetical protein